MASTSATRRQSEAIRAAMAEIRSELPYDVDDARERVKQLSDWKYHVAQRPFLIMAAAAVVGFLIVPTKRRSEKVVIHHGQAQPAVEPVKRGMLAGVMGTVATLVLRQVATAASKQIAEQFSLASKSYRSATQPTPSTHREIPR